MKYAGTFKIPTHAISMLEYGDVTGLTDMDIELVNGFVYSNLRRQPDGEKIYNQIFWTFGGNV